MLAQIARRSAAGRFRSTDGESRLRRAFSWHLSAPESPMFYAQMEPTANAGLIVAKRNRRRAPEMVTFEGTEVPPCAPAYGKPQALCASRDRWAAPPCS